MHWSIVCKFSTLIGQLLSAHQACHSGSFIRWRSTSHETSFISSPPQKDFFMSVQRSPNRAAKQMYVIRTRHQKNQDKWFWFSPGINNSILIIYSYSLFAHVISVSERFQDRRMVFVSDINGGPFTERAASRLELITDQATQMIKKSNVLLLITLLFYGHKWIN